MLDKLATTIVNCMYNHCSFPDRRKAVYVYGCKLAISTLVSTCTILLMAFFLGETIYGISFIMIFVSLRLFLGGLHASTYRNCFLISNATFLLSYGAGMLLSNLQSPIVPLLILVVASSVIRGVGPIENHNHPISDQAFQKNKRNGFLLLGIEFFLSIIIYLATKNIHILSIFATSFAAVAAMMILPVLKERRVAK